MLSTVPNVKCTALSLNLGAPKHISNIGSHLNTENSGSQIKLTKFGLKACKHFTHKIIISVKLQNHNKTININYGLIILKYSVLKLTYSLNAVIASSTKPALSESLIISS